MTPASYLLKLKNTNREAYRSIAMYFGTFGHDLGSANHLKRLSYQARTALTQLLNITWLQMIQLEDIEKEMKQRGIPAKETPVKAKSSP